MGIREALAAASILVGLLAGSAQAQELAQEDANFAAWRAAFRSEALSQGISAATFDSAFEGITVNARVLELDAFQPEFTRAIWDYLDGAVSDTRVETGRARMAENVELLAQVEGRYNVDAHVVVAIWGLESSYGQIKGNTNIIEALATLAYDGRRAAWARSQLIAALQILEEGNMEPDAMRGSWAGAMGHTQFIPTSYLQYAVDFDGDGRRDLVNTHADALGSTASYLASFGWSADEPWGIEVILPEGFAYALTGRHNIQSFSQWRSLGVIYADGTPLPNTDDVASIIVPGGAGGPGFLIFDNFSVIMRYNNSTAYALAIGHLSDRLRGGDAFVGTWPRDARPLTRDERVEMQRLLAGHGYSPGPADGIVGARTRAAVRAFQRERDLPEDGFASAVLLERMRQN